VQCAVVSGAAARSSLYLLGKISGFKKKKKRNKLQMNDRRLTQRTELTSKTTLKGQ
jgi:hypothetical protein